MLLLYPLGSKRSLGICITISLKWFLMSMLLNHVYQVLEGAVHVYFGLTDIERQATSLAICKTNPNLLWLTGGNTWMTIKSMDIRKTWIC